MIVVRMRGDFGNQMFIAAFAVSLRKVSTRPVFLDSLGSLPRVFKFRKSEHIRAVIGYGLVRLASLPLVRACVKRFDRTDLTKIYTRESFAEFDGIIAIVDGYFQSSLYFYNRDCIRRFFRFSLVDRSIQVPAIKSKVIVVHYRRGDYKQFDPLGVGKPFLLPDSYFLNAMERARRLFPDAETRIVSDEFSEAAAFVDRIPWVCRVEERPPISDFLELVSADCLVLSNSSFSWWGAYLNVRSATVFCPERFSGHYVEFEFPAGIIEEDWIEVAF